MTLRPYNVRYRPTAFLDVATARGVTDVGATVRPVLGGRRTKNAQLIDYLETARAAGVERVYLTGARPTPPAWHRTASDWLLLDAPGWSAGRHHFDAEHPAGRFTHDLTGASVQLRRASEWFGDVDSPAEAREAWALLRTVYAVEFGGAVLFDSPNGTAQDAYLRALPRDADRRPVAPEQVPEDIAALIHATSAQNRVEFLPPAADTIGAFVYYDARFAYASLTRELGCAPVVRMTGDKAHAFALASPYARARYRVTFGPPNGWPHVGAFMVQDSGHGWHTPPVGTTWTDAAELHTALRFGWSCHVTEALVFTKGRPLDTWTDKLHRMRERFTHDAATGAVTERAAQLASGAVRRMLIVGIGGFASRGYRATRVYRSSLDVPAGVEVEPRGDVFISHERIDLDARGRLLHHPEWSSQVWGRAHARLLDAPTADRQVRAGAWHVPPAELLGMRADALYMTSDPRWPDDGKPGRYRLAGALDGPLPAPRTATELNDLRRRAAAKLSTGGTA